VQQKVLEVLFGPDRLVKLGCLRGATQWGEGGRETPTEGY
jgi:hypothetical protein